MPAKSKEAVKRKKDNRQSKLDIERETRIEELGGNKINVEYGKPLSLVNRKVRINYLFTLLYPNKDKPKRERNKSSRDTPVEVNMFYNAKSRARSKEVPFTITREDIVVPDTCPLLNIPLVRSKGNYTDNSPTLDRILPELGYVKGNVQVISMRANRIKDNASFEEFERIYFNWKSLNSNHNS